MISTKLSGWAIAESSLTVLPDTKALLIFREGKEGNNKNHPYMGNLEVLPAFGEMVCVCFYVYEKERE